METKRRGWGNGGVQQVGPDRFRLYYEAPREPGQQRNRRSESFRGTKEGAQKRLRALMGTVDRGDWRKPRLETVGEFLGRWLRDHVDGRTSPRTRQGYEFIIRRYVEPVIGVVALSSLQPEHVLALHRSMAEHGLSGRTQLHAHRLLSNALTRAVKWRDIDRNPCQMVDAPRPEHHEMAIWDFEQGTSSSSAATSSP